MAPFLLLATEALGKLGNNYAVSPLIDIVSDKTEQSIYLKESATKALGMIGDMRAVEPLVAILESNESFISKFSFLKERILETLRKIGSKDDRTFKAIKKSAENEGANLSDWKMIRDDYTKEDWISMIQPYFKAIHNKYPDKSKEIVASELGEGNRISQATDDQVIELENIYNQMVTFCCDMGIVVDD